MRTGFFYSGLLIVIIALSVSAYLFRASTNVSKALPEEGRVLIGGAFTLENTKGQEVRDTDFHGKLMLVYFGFTYCPDVCPAGLQTMSQVLKQLGGERDEVQPLFITLDPERDTKTQMASYMKHFDAGIIGLTGTKEQVDAVIAAYRVYANKVPGKNASDYMMDHSAFMYLMDREGNYITHFSPDSTVAAIVEAVEKNL